MAAARQTALMSGQVDLIDRVDLPTVNLLERAPGIRIISLNGGEHYGFPMDTRAAPFSDNHVRMALKLAIDWAIARDDEPVPMLERPHVKAMQHEPDARQILAGQARYVRQAAARTAPLHQVGPSAAGLDAGAARW